jgi:hypothetical protein
MAFFLIGVLRNGQVIFGDIRKWSKFELWPLGLKLWPFVLAYITDNGLCGQIFWVGLPLIIIMLNNSTGV